MNTKILNKREQNTFKNEKDIMTETDLSQYCKITF